MSEEDIQKAKDEAAERERQLVETIANLEQDKANVVSELVAKRESERLAREELERIKGTQDPNNKSTDPEEIVTRVLQRKEQEEAKIAFDEAKAELKRTYNEFAPETDTAGIVFGKFEKELSKFNFSGLKTKEEYRTRLKDVYDFMNREKKQEEARPDLYKGTPQFGSDANVRGGDTLSDGEMKLIKDMGWDKERFLKVKEKRPAYVASLLKYRG